MTSTLRRSTTPAHARHRPRKKKGGNADWPQRTVTAAPAGADNAFVRLGVPNSIAGGLAAGGIVEPFPIQAATLPDSLSGRDLLGRGQTGSGKTIAFAIPLVAMLAGSESRTRPGHPRGLVLVPTRELAKQVADVVAPLAATVRLRVATVVGGVSQGGQVGALQKGADIVIACPGRLEDLVGQRHCHLDQVEVTVLDEADMMSDLGFLPAVRRLLDATPAGGQRLLFSATLDDAVSALVERFLVDHVVHALDPGEASVGTMQHHLLAISADDKAAIVRGLASGDGRAILFTRTKHGARKWARQLSAAGIAATELHGNLSQSARARSMQLFTSGKSRVLVATDVAARGIHVDDVALVVHVDPPVEHKSYLHRSGRTARAGSSGTVVTLVTPDQSHAARRMVAAAGITTPFTTARAGDELIGALAGGTAVAPSEVAAPAARAERQNRRRRRR